MAHTRRPLHRRGPPHARRGSDLAWAAYWRWKHGASSVHLRSHVGCQAPSRQPGTQAEAERGLARCKHGPLASVDLAYTYVRHAWAQTIDDHACMHVCAVGSFQRAIRSFARTYHASGPTPAQSSEKV